jgi:branched-chain amino acid transport system permease protein
LLPAAVNRPRATMTSATAPAATMSALPMRAHPAPSSGALMDIASVSKSYGGVRPARDVSFSLTEGHIHALIGPNGAGKTTMINMLSGIAEPDGGEIKFLGQSILQRGVEATTRLGLARTFQNLRLFNDLSVRDNVLLGQHARMRNGFFTSLFALPGASREESRAETKVAAILALTGLSAHADQTAGSLAYGLQRRVELARALATEPRLLLLDEPAAGLNPSETAQLGDLLLEIRRQGITILLVEHHMDLVMRISDHVIVLDYGAKIAEGPPARIQSDTKVITAYLGVDQVAA